MESGEWSVERAHSPLSTLHSTLYTALRFQRPRLNISIARSAKLENAMGMERKTPCAPIPSFAENSQASGISHAQNQNRFKSVGVQVSPAPLKALAITMP